VGNVRATGDFAQTNDCRFLDSGQSCRAFVTFTPSALGERTGNLVVDARTPGAPTKTIALVGVRDLVVVETDDALLVVPRERCQDVRAVVESLKAKRPEHL
jgi:hypothetical protein